MVHDRKLSSRRAAVALLVLLWHVALIGLFALTLRPHETLPEDSNALQAVILPYNYTGSPEKPSPIKLKLRVPDPPATDFALEIPIIVPVEVTPPQDSDPSLTDVASAVPDANGEEGQDSSKGAAVADGVAGTSTLRTVWPVYPDRAVVAQQEGSVAVSFTIDRSGRPVDLRVQHSSGFERLDQAAVHAFSQWRFPPGAPPRELTIRAGFGLAARPTPLFLPVFISFDTAAVARINASARHTTLEGLQGQSPRRLIANLLEMMGSVYPDASDPRAVRRWPRVFVMPESSPVRLTGTPPWPRNLDGSPVLNARLMGLVTLKGLEVDGTANASRNWLALAVRQEQSTSEWLLGVTPRGVINKVLVMNGGPTCAAAPGSAACAPIKN